MTDSEVHPAAPPGVGSAEPAALRALFEHALRNREPRTGGQEADQAVEDLVGRLFAPLRLPSGPRASAAAEAAFVLCGIAVARGLVPRMDVRLRRDRTGSELASGLLLELNIPATKGAFQSNTYRGGYRAPQARATALNDFVDWMEEPGRTVQQVRNLLDRLGAEFTSYASSLPALPRLVSERFTFARTRRLIESLRAHGSGGAYEQYLIAGLLDQEYDSNGLRWRVETKPVGASDSASKAIGDVQVRHRQQMQYALEVSAANWRWKVPQAVATVRASRLDQAAVVAEARDMSGEEIEAVLGDDQGVDVAVIDIDGYLDSVSARLRPAQRAQAIRLVYAHLVRWNRARADLTKYLVEQLQALDLTGEGTEEVPAIEPSIKEAAERLRILAAGPESGEVPISRRDLRLLLGWAEEIS